MTLQRVTEEILYAYDKQGQSCFLVASSFNGEGDLPVAKELTKLLEENKGVKVQYHEVQKTTPIEAPPSTLVIVGGDGLLENVFLVRQLEYVQAAILVVQAMVTDRQYVQESMQILIRHEISLLGTVLNYGKRPIPSFLQYLTR